MLLGLLQNLFLEQYFPFDVLDHLFMLLRLLVVSQLVLAFELLLTDLAIKLREPSIILFIVFGFGLGLLVRD